MTSRTDNARSFTIRVVRFVRLARIYRREVDRMARDEALEARAQAKRLYRAGRSPFLTALNSERTLAQAGAAVAASEGQVAAGQVKLFLALGGGWEQTPPVVQVGQR
jgi:outer membrane protein TolC